MATRNRKVLFAIAAAAVFVIVRFWSRLGDRELQRDVHADAVPRTARDPVNVASGAATGHDATSDQREAVGTARATERDAGALFVPNYGPALRRPFARAEFELRDAHEQPLEGGVVVGAELWRKTDEGWVQHPAELDRVLSRIVCAGSGGAGLPPGEYELDIRAGPYGARRERFALGRGDSLWRTLEFPNWRRIVRVRFEDARGRPLPRITQAPRYVYEPVELPAVERGVPAEIADAPLPFGFGTTSTGWEAYYETRNGMLCARVFAGHRAKLTIGLESWRWGRDAVVLESDFLGEEWEGFPVALDPVPDLEEQMRTWVHVNQGDPGLYSLFDAPINPTPGVGDPANESDLLPGYVRVVVAVDALTDVRMQSHAGPPRRATPTAAIRERWPRADVWYMDVMRDPEIADLTAGLAFTDDRLLFVRATPVELPLASERRRIDVEFRVDATPAQLELVPASPTLAAYADAIELEVAMTGTQAGRAFAIPRDRDGSFIARTALTADDARELAAGAAWTLHHSAGGQRCFSVTRELTQGERAGLLSGGLRLALDSPGFAARIVDRAGDGVAGVSCAVVGADNLAAAEQLRTAALARAHDEGTSASEAARATAGIAGWLDGENVADADRDGYLLVSSLQLTEGHRFALFSFWRKNGELRSHRVDFLATRGVTDLGAVFLP